MTATGDGLPKYARVAAAVRGQIADGTLRPGQPAPSGAALSRVTGYSTLTCRRALRVLVADGVLTPGPSRNARPRVAGIPQRSGERDLAAATRALSAGLAARRRAAGLTQPELARHVGVSVTTVGHAETGRVWQSRQFWERADAVLDAGGGLLRLHDAYRTASAAEANGGQHEAEFPALPPGAEAGAGPRADARREQDSAQRLPLHRQPAAVSPGVPSSAGAQATVLPSCVMIVWADGTVTTVRPPEAAAPDSAPGGALPG
jgi:Helix-turn-helix domain/Bacterial regulatory proteins, gntR family